MVLKLELWLLSNFPPAGCAASIHIYIIIKKKKLNNKLQTTIKINQSNLTAKSYHSLWRVFHNLAEYMYVTKWVFRLRQASAAALNVAPPHNFSSV